MFSKYKYLNVNSVFPTGKSFLIASFPNHCLPSEDGALNM